MCREFEIGSNGFGNIRVILFLDGVVEFLELTSMWSV